MADGGSSNLLTTINDAINEKVEEGKETFVNMRNEVSNGFGNMVTKFVNGLEALRFDPDKMSIAYLAIYDGFKKLSETIRQINDDVFSAYITDNQVGSKGTAIDVETLSDTLSNLWHGAVDVRLDDFISHYQEWSEVMSFVEKVNEKYIEEAEATYGEGFKNSPFAQLFAYTGTKTSEIGVTLNNNDRKEAMSVFDINLTKAQIDEKMSHMSEEQTRYIDQKAEEYVTKNIDRYNEAMTRHINEGDPLPNWITRMNPIYRNALQRRSTAGSEGVE